jgi:hypothetical protein
VHKEPTVRFVISFAAYFFKAQLYTIYFSSE